MLALTISLVCFSSHVKIQPNSANIFAYLHWWELHSSVSTIHCCYRREINIWSVSPNVATQCISNCCHQIKIQNCLNSRFNDQSKLLHLDSKILCSNELSQFSMSRWYQQWNIRTRIRSNITDVTQMTSSFLHLMYLDQEKLCIF